MASDIKIPVKHKINLMTFFFVPCGAQVESKLCYLAEVYKFYVSKLHRRIAWAAIRCVMTIQPQILHPLYTISGFVLATTEDRGVDASDLTGDEPQTTLKAMKRRYQRGIETLREPDNIYCWKNDPPRAEEWKQTLATVNEAGKWLIMHEETIEEFTQSKARGKATASSSSSGEPMMTAKAKWLPGAPTAARLPETPP